MRRITQFNQETAPAVFADLIATKYPTPMWGTDEQIYAKIITTDGFPQTMLIIDRTFTASCSSHWSWGLIKTPAVTIPYGPSEINGPSDIFNELGEDAIREGLKKAHIRLVTGQPQVAYTGLIINLDIADAYHQGVHIDISSFRKLIAFHEMLSGVRFQQAHYRALYCENDTAILLADNDKGQDPHLSYLVDSMVILRNIIPVNIAIGWGSIYYITHKVSVSPAINQNWLDLRAVPPNTTVISAEARAVIGDAFDRLLDWN